MTREPDLHVVTLREKVIIAPRSATGMLWLQLHFLKEEWGVLSQGSFLLSRDCATELVIDAQEAELIIDFE